MMQRLHLNLRQGHRVGSSHSSRPQRAVLPVLAMRAVIQRVKSASVEVWINTWW